MSRTETQEQRKLRADAIKAQNNSKKRLSFAEAVRQVQQEGQENNV